MRGGPRILAVLVAALVLVGGCGGGAEEAWPPTTPAASAPKFTIVFMKQGDVHVVQSDGTGLRRLTTDGPRWRILDPELSPDGREVAFSRNGGINVLTLATGQTRELTTGPGDGGPAWSPDGTTIVFTRSAKLFTMSAADGSGARQLLDLGRLTSQRDPTWFRVTPPCPAPPCPPPFELIAFSSFSKGRADIHTVRPDGTGVADLTDSPGIDIAPVGTGTGGGRIAFQRENSAMVMGWDGSGQRVVAAAGPHAGIEVTVAAYPSWSPDGEWLTYVASDRKGSELMVFRLSGGAEHRILRLAQVPD